MSRIYEQSGWIKPAATGLLAWLALTGCGGVPRPAPSPSETAQASAICRELQVMLVGYQAGKWVVEASTTFSTTGDARVATVDYTFARGEPPVEVPTEPVAPIVQHTYTEPGTYDISAQLKVEEDGHTALAPQETNCSVRFTVGLPPPPSPS